MSLYIRVHSSFWQHRKTLRLRALIGKDAWWLLPKLWDYAAINQPDGDFSDYAAEELAMLVAYDGDAQAMLEALQQAGFMDGMKIHDWAEHNGYHSFFSERAKMAARARWKGKDKIRKERKRKDSSIASSNACSMAGFPPEFSVEWQHFIEHRKIKKAPMTAHAQDLILRTLRQRPTEAVQAIQMAQARNWTGFQWDWYDGNNPNGEVVGRFQRQLSAFEIEKRIAAINERRNQIYRAAKSDLGTLAFSPEARAELDRLSEKKDELKAQLTQ